MTSKKVREFLRSHVLGLVAIFIALTGTAVAGQQSGAGGDPQASASVVTDAKFKKLKKRVAALEAKTSLPPNGPAGGSLTGTYPNPTIAANAVTTEKIANGAVTSGKFFHSTVQTINFGTILAEACATVPVPGGGISATDHVVVTPPPGFPDTFTITGIPNPSLNVINLALCNTFTSGGADPDGAGGPYKALVIR